MDDGFLPPVKPVDHTGLLPPELETAHGLLPDVQSNVTQTKIQKRNLSDYTSGAFQYGAASSLESLSKLASNVSEKMTGYTLGLDHIAKSLEAFKKENPQYAPEQADSALDLLTSPGKLVSHVMSGAPQFLGTAALIGATGGWIGIPLAAAINGGIDGQNIYDDAKSRGVSEDDAQRAALLGGTVAAVTQIIPEAQLYKYATGGRVALAKLAFREASARVEAQAARIGRTLSEEEIKAEGLKAMSAVMKREISPQIAEGLMKSSERNALTLSNLTMAPSKTIADQTVGRFLPQGVTDATAQALSLGGWSAGGGAAEEGIKRLNYGSADKDKALPDFSWSNFFHDRAMEFVGGAATAIGLGVPLHLTSRVKPWLQSEAPDFSTLQPDLVNRDQFYKIVEPHLTAEQIPVWRALSDTIFQTYAEKNGMMTADNADRAVGHMISISHQARDPSDMLLAQTPKGIAHFFDAVERHIESPEFESNFQGKAVPASQVLKWLQKEKTGLKADNLFWTGMKSALENLKEQKVTAEDVRNLDGVNFETMVKQRYSMDEYQGYIKQYKELKAQLVELQAPRGDAFTKPDYEQKVLALQQKMTELKEEGLKLKPKNLDASDLGRVPGLKDNFTEIVIHQPESPNFYLVNGQKHLTLESAEAAAGRRLSEEYISSDKGYVDPIHYPKVPHYLLDLTLASGHVVLPQDTQMKFDEAAFKRSYEEALKTHGDEVLPYETLKDEAIAGAVENRNRVPVRAILELQSNRAQEYAKMLVRFVREQKYAKDAELQGLKDNYLSTSVDFAHPIKLEGLSDVATTDAQVHNQLLERFKKSLEGGLLMLKDVNTLPDAFKDNKAYRDLFLHYQQMNRVHGREFQMKGMPQRIAALEAIKAKLGEAKFEEKLSDLMSPKGLDENRAKLLSGPLMAEAKLWVSHGIKQAALDAVEGGFSHLALPDPETVADRWHRRPNGNPNDTEGDLWKGMHYFYNVVLPNIAEKLFRQYDPKHKGSVEAEVVGGKKTSIFRTNEGVEREPTLDETRLPQTSGQMVRGTQKVRTLEITPDVRQRIILGQPLYQKENHLQFLSRMKEEYKNRKVKAIMDTKGHLYTGDVEDHEQLFQMVERVYGLTKKNFRATGEIGGAGTDTPFFVGTDGGMQLYPEKDGSFYSRFSTDTHLVDIKDPKQISVMQPKEYLAQAKNASIEFQRQADGLQRAFFTFNPTTNFSTPLHEMAHLLTVFSSPEERAQMSEAVGRDFGHWGTVEYEKIADMFEKYLQKGQAPVASLQGTFDSASDFFAKVYTNFRNSTLDKYLNPAAKKVFDNWFFKDTPEVLAQRELVDKAQALVDGVAQLPQNGKYQVLIDRAESELKATNQELVRIQMSQRSRESEVELRQEWNEARQRSLKLESSEETKARLGMNYLWNPGTLSQIIDYTKPMENFPAGRRAREEAFGVNARTRQIATPEIYEKDEVVKKHATSAVVKELNSAVDLPSGKGGAVKARQYFDRSDANRQPIAAGSAIQKIFQLNAKINSNAQQRAVDDGIFRKYSDGTRQPWRAAQGEESVRYARIFDNEFYDRFGKDSTYTNAVVDCIIEMDSSLKPKDREGLMEILDDHIKDPDIRRSAALEFGRVLKGIPDYVNIKGKQVAVLVMDFRQVLERTIVSQARRTAFIEKFGQGLDTANIAHWSRFAKILNVTIDSSESTLRAKLIAAKDDSGAPIVSQVIADMMSFKELARLAKSNNVPIKPTKDEYKDVTNSIRAADLRDSNGQFNKTKVKEVTALAKLLGAITLEAPFPDLLEEVRSRLNETPVDLAQKLKQEYMKQGGNLTQWDTLMKQAQGIDAWRVERGNWWKSFAPFRDSITSAKMMFNAPLNAIQHLNVLPLVGLKIWGNAVKQQLMSPETTHATLNALGIIPEVGSLFSRDLNLTSTPVRWASEKVAEVTMQNRSDYFMRSVIGIAGGAYADSLNGNVSKADIPQLRNLKISPAEIEMLKAKEMTPELKAKIAQGIFDRAVAYGNPQIKKGYLDSQPLAKFLYAYGSFSVGMSRYGVDLFGEMKAHFKDFVVDTPVGVVKGDLKQSIEGLKSGYKLAQKVTYLLAAAGGTYLVGQAFRALLTGNVSKQKKEDNIVEKGVQALLDFGLVGPANRFLSSAKHDGGSPERIYATMMPQLTSVVKLLGALLPPNPVTEFLGVEPQGKYANYSYGQRVLKTVRDEIPLAKAIENWKVTMAFPESQLYDETVSAVSAYASKSEQLRGKYSASAPAFENPATYPVFEKIRRFDVQGAQEEAMRYYQAEAADLENPQNILHGSPMTFSGMRSKLRAALLSRAPLSLPKYENLTFLSAASPDQQNKYMKADAMYRAYVDAVAPESKPGKKWSDKQKGE